MKIKRATKEYAAWLAAHTQLVPDDLACKYKYMAQGKDSGLFVFFRATFYRWAQIWPQLCPELALAPALLAVGDLHVANFGTWRNAKEQLVWGINDLDEAAILPYTADLLRLATSADIAIRAHELDMECHDACNSILSGYAAGLKTGGRPFILDAAHDWLYRLTASDARQQKQWWRELLKSQVVQEPIPTSALDVLQQLMPEPNLPFQIVHREAGVGSLGRQRWTMIASQPDQRVVREVKALVPSAWQWANQRDVTESFVAALLAQAIRSPDPYVRVEQGWITRRLAPDSRRIDLDMLHSKRAERLLYAMGQETANMHLGSPAAIPAVQHDLASRPAGWLHAAVQIMTAALTEDWKDWRRDPIRLT